MWTPTPRTGWIAGKSTTPGCCCTRTATSTINRADQQTAGKGGDFAPPFLFLLFPLFLGIFFQGGDWPPATLLIRASLFLLGALCLLRCDAITLRPNVIDLLIVALWLVEAASLPRAGYRWISYQWFLHHSAVLILYALWRAHPDPGGKATRYFGTLIVAAAGVEFLLALFQRFAAGEGRPSGTLQTPNLLAEFLVYGGIVAFFGFVRAGKGAAERRWLPYLIVLLLAGVLMTYSRGGILVAVAAGVYLLAGRYGWKRTLPAAVLVGAVFLLASSTLVTRFLGKGDPYAFERVNMWNASFRIFLDHPTGVGAGHFKYFWPAARDPVEGSVIRYARYAVTPHSEFFSILSELGAPGAAAFLGLGVAGFFSLRRAARLREPAVSGAVMILFASFLHAAVETNYHIIGFLLLNAAALAVVSGRLWEPVWEKEIRVRGAVRWASVALLAVMAVYSGITLAGGLLEVRGHAALKEGRVAEAVRHLSRAVATDPWRSTAPDSLSAVLFSLYESGKSPEYLSEAIESEVEASNRNPMEFRYFARLGFLYTRAADYYPGPARGTVLRASLASYERAVRLNPHSADLRYQKALMLRAMGRAQESRRLIGEVLSDEPRFARGWALVGELLEVEDRGKAVSAYEKALELYYTDGKSTSDPDEREFLSLDAKAVEKRVRALRADRNR